MGIEGNDEDLSKNDYDAASELIRKQILEEKQRPKTVRDHLQMMASDPNVPEEERRWASESLSLPTNEHGI